MSAREELTKKLNKLYCERDELVEKCLFGEEFMKYLGLEAQIIFLEDYLKDHDDEYVEKDRAFDHKRCPLDVEWDEEKDEQKGQALAESPSFRECGLKECPDFESCLRKIGVEEIG